MAKKSEPPDIVLADEKILAVRGHRVLLDRDLAELYGETTFRLNEGVKRNRHRFPDDFMFQLKTEEFHELARLTSQIAISNETRGGRRTMPYVFTEQGVAMLSSVLNSERAIQVNIAIMRAFVRMRSLTSANRELASKVLEHEAVMLQ